MSGNANNHDQLVWENPPLVTPAPATTNMGITLTLERVSQISCYVFRTGSDVKSPGDRKNNFIGVLVLQNYNSGFDSTYTLRRLYTARHNAKNTEM